MLLTFWMFCQLRINEQFIKKQTNENYCWTRSVNYNVVILIHHNSNMWVLCYHNITFEQWYCSTIIIQKRLVNAKKLKFLFLLVFELLEINTYQIIWLSIEASYFCSSCIKCSLVNETYSRFYEQISTGLPLAFSKFFQVFKSTHFWVYF